MLMRYRKDDLVRLCEERDIDHGGRKKAQLVDALLQWVRPQGLSRSSRSS